MLSHYGPLCALPGGPQRSTLTEEILCPGLVSRRRDHGGRLLALNAPQSGLARLGGRQRCQVPCTLNSMATRPAWLGKVSPGCSHTSLGSNLAPQILPCEPNRSFYLSKPWTPQLQSGEALLNFFLSINSYGGPVTWAGGLLPDAVGLPPPPQSQEVLPTRSLHPHPEEARGLPVASGPGPLLSAWLSFPHSWHLTLRLGLFPGVPGIKLSAPPSFPTPCPAS